MNAGKPAKPQRLSRRRAIGSAVTLAALAGVTGLRLRAEPQRPGGSAALARSGSAPKLGESADANGGPAPTVRALRPPGALPEDHFAAACVRCSLCVQACPYNTLRLAGEHDPVAVGTPFFVARETPCFMCDVPCRRACPTGALSEGPLDIRAARIGVAGIIAPERCYSVLGAAKCDSCVKACPLNGSAIWLQKGPTPLGGHFTPTVNASVCTGCGLCEKACIATVEAIAVQVRT